ncbi:hypothetical protein RCSIMONEHASTD_58 [Rhodobacter phage RcSimone-Hastad]|nr:hypothetical protein RCSIMONEHASTD_58 [Rhodobacter phage RcSimone-Hastad]
MTTKELLAKLNVLRVRAGKTELANWKSSREKLESTIADLVEELGDVDEGETVETQSTDEPEVVETQSTEQSSDLSDVEGRTDETEETKTEEKEAPLIPRGAIGAMSIELLTGSDEPYADIVAKIVAKYPTAKTTARSLASVAMDLRRDGVEVPSRRKPAKAKTEPAKASEETAGE